MPLPPDPRDLGALAQHLLAHGPERVLSVAGRRIRVQFNGTYIADTTSAVLVWEHAHYPYYYVPVTSLARNEEGGVEIKTVDEVAGGGARVLEVRVKERKTRRVVVFDRGVAAAAAAAAKDGKSKELEGMARIEFAAADAWFVEDERVFVHPKDPFKRVDCVRSARSVVVARNGVELARCDAGGAVHLYETGLPTRYYLPVTSVREGVLRPSDTVTSCPYKGDANYYDVVLGHGEVCRDLVWWYKCPTVECAAIAGLVCFYNEKVDIEVGGAREVRPVTGF